MRAEIDPSNWWHSRIYEDTEVAIATGHATDFWDLPENTQALLIARFRARGTREAYEEKLHQQEMHSRNKNRRGRGVTR